jgi:WD40 repeat protein
MPDLRAQTDKLIFLSYSRANRAFALELRQKLADLGFKLWRDIEDMPIGEKWWQALQEAIRECETVILCMSPESLASPNVADEWQYAREQGKRVMPIVAADVNFTAVPRWMGRFDWADFRPGAKDADLVWARLINQLNTPYEPRKVPFMVEALPPDFVPRPAEFAPLVNALVEASHRAVAISAALKGAGGYGKTTLCRAICLDRQVRAAFDDGTLWATLGEKVSEQDLVAKLLDLVVKLTGTRPSVVGVTAASDELRKAIGDRYVLLVVDDVWWQAHLEPFLNIGAHAATLITTRNGGTLPADAFKQPVDAMQANEALALLHYKLSAGENSTLSDLAKRLGEWPVLLKLANGALRKRIAHGETLTVALEWVAKALSRKGFDAFDNPDDKGQRNSAVSATLGVSLELLDSDQRAKYERLAIFPEDVDVPLVTLEKLWGLDDFDVEELCQRCADLSLLLNYDLNARTIRLHDVVRTYLCDAHKDDLPKWNSTFLDHYNQSNWHTLSPDEPYLWRFLAYHLVNAGNSDELRAALLDYRFLRAKLGATDANALQADCDALLKLGKDEPIRVLRSALSMSAHVLRDDPDALGHQLVGRMMGHRKLNDEVRAFTDTIPVWQPGLYPANFDSEYVTHEQAGGFLLRTLEGHSELVSGALALTDGRILSSSFDSTIRLWTADGAPLAELEKHTGWVLGTLALSDGRFLSWSDDQTLRLWASNGAPLVELQGHTARVTGAQALIDGRFLSWSWDKMLRLWTSDGAPLTVLEGHTDDVNGARTLTDGRFLSWSDDQTLRLWASDGAPLAVLTGHTDSLSGALALADGRFLSWSNDKTLRLWASDGAPLAVLEGHTENVNGALTLSDGRFISWSQDKTLRLWMSDGAPLAVLKGHTGPVTGAQALIDGRFLSWSGDKTLRLWASNGAPLAVLEGHTDDVNGALTLTDGRFLSWSGDKTLRLWASDGALLAVLTGHTWDVTGVQVLADGRYLSWSMDKTLRLWASDGAPLAVLNGHTLNVKGVRALADNRFLSWSADGTLRLWTGDGTPLSMLEGHTKYVDGALALFDGRFLSWSGDKTLRLWASDGAPLAVLTGHTSNVSRALALFDGRFLSWSEDKTLRLWASDGAPLAVMAGHTASVDGALALADGRFLSWSYDNTLRLWASDGAPLAALNEPKRGNREKISQWADLHGFDPQQIWVDLHGFDPPQIWAEPKNAAGLRVRTVEDKTIVLYQADDGKRISTIYADANITAPVFLADGVTIAAGDFAGRVIFLRWRDS